MTQRYFPFFPGQGGGQGGGQGFGPPGGGQGFGPPGPPPGGPGGKGPGGKGPGGKGGPPSGGGGGTAPTSPPPGFTPSQSQAYSLHGGGGGAGGQYGAYAVAPITLRYCLFRYVYIWPSWGPGFWAWLIFVGRGTAAGFRWTGRRWVYFGMDTRQISAFYCY
nr:hypothetical protein [Fictibacillus halophilus]